jgi:hypothetical protein
MFRKIPCAQNWSNAWKIGRSKETCIKSDGDTKKIRARRSLALPIFKLPR